MHRALLGIALAAVTATATAATYESGNSGVLEITPHNVGPINLDFRFDEQALRAALPGYTVQVQEVGGEEGSYMEAQVSRDGQPVLDVIPDIPGDDGTTPVLSVTVQSPEVDNTLGPKVGASFAEAADGLDRVSCEPGMDEYSGKVICGSPGPINIRYVFSGQWDGPDGELPPDAVLQGFKLEQIIWTNPERM